MYAVMCRLNKFQDDQNRWRSAWMFSGFVEDIEMFDMKNFRKDNPNGEVVLIDLDNLPNGAEHLPSKAPDITTVELHDGRKVDIFSATGGVQVYTADLQRGYELKLPTVPAVEQQLFIGQRQKGPDFKATLGVSRIG